MYILLIRFISRRSCFLRSGAIEGGQEEELEGVLGCRILLAFAVALLPMMMMKTCVKCRTCIQSLRRFPCPVQYSDVLHLPVPSGQLSVVVALAASMSWRCFMEWKTRCASAVASSFRHFLRFVVHAVPGGGVESLARDSDGEEELYHLTFINPSACCSLHRASARR